MIRFRVLGFGFRVGAPLKPGPRNPKPKTFPKITQMGNLPSPFSSVSLEQIL